MSNQGQGHFLTLAQCHLHVKIKTSPKPLGQSMPNSMWSFWEWGKKVYINGLVHMTKMAAMPIYGKNL